MAKLTVLINVKRLYDQARGIEIPKIMYHERPYAKADPLTGNAWMRIINMGTEGETDDQFQLIGYGLCCVRTDYHRDVRRKVPMQRQIRGMIGSSRHSRWNMLLNDVLDKSTTMSYRYR